MHKHLKFFTVIGEISLNNSNSILPTFFSPILISKKTIGFSKFTSFGGIKG